MNAEADREWHPFEPPAWKQIDAMLPYTEILFPPGSKFSYSNPGLIYLGRVIETLTNEDYAMYVTKNIFSPLGMSHAFFNRAPYHLRPHRSHSYFRTDEGVKEQRFDFDTGITVANGGLNAPLTDMAKYVAFLIGDPKKQAGYDVVLKRTSMRIRRSLAVGLQAGCQNFTTHQAFTEDKECDMRYSSYRLRLALPGLACAALALRARQGISESFWPPMHPGRRRCSSLT